MQNINCSFKRTAKDCRDRQQWGRYLIENNSLLSGVVKHFVEPISLVHWDFVETVYLLACLFLYLFNFREKKKSHMSRMGIDQQLTITPCVQKKALQRTFLFLVWGLGGPEVGLGCEKLWLWQENTNKHVNRRWCPHAKTQHITTSASGQWHSQSNIQV